MIKKDQPTIFDSNATVAVSSVDDGNMKFGVNEGEDVAANRKNFLDAVGISLDQTTPITLTYDRDDYADYRIVAKEDKGKAMYQPEKMQPVDAIVTTEPNHALFLAPADCCGVVLHDPVKGVLMLSHIGRHSAEVDGALRSVAYLQEKCGSQPADLKVWLGPAVGKATYPLLKKDGMSLHELITGQLIETGVRRENIEVSSVDTAMDPNYFSHSQWKAGNRSGGDGRFAVVAMMRGRGETAS